MNRWRLVFLAVIVLAGIFLVVGLVHNKTRQNLESSLAPAFQLLGKPIKLVDRAFTRMMPIDAWDEKDYGETILQRFPNLGSGLQRGEEYVQELMFHLSKFAQKPFKYRIFMINEPSPNAFALPGGVILVTVALLNVLETEGELVSILAHEMGHVERSHCLDAVRFQLLARKTGDSSLGEIADAALSILLKHSFSKTQENEADEYAYQLLLNTSYDPCSMGSALQRFMIYAGESSNRKEKANILRDYFMSHPPLRLRAATFSEKAKQWWLDHPNESRYRGATNLRMLRSFYTDSNNPAEWRGKD